MTVPTDGAPVGNPDVAVTFTPATNTGPAPQFIQTPASQPAPSAARWTDEDLARAREQEKSKLYGKIETLEQQMARFNAEREAETARLEAERLAAEETARKQAEAETDVRTLLEQQRAEFEARLDAERRDRENAQALLVQEQKFQQLNEYKAQAIAANQDNIIPDLVRMVQGNTPEEIDASIAGLVETSSSILASAQAAMQSQRQNMAGARVTAPAAGPLDITSDSQPLTPEQIANLSMNDYARHRSNLLGQASQTNKGLFG